jgi:hypothetical protein
MGQAKQRKKLGVRILERHPSCCYCGGAEKATTIDHVPAKIVFPNKHRPAGLEVPACSPCNRGTSKFDQMAGVFSRLSEMDPVQTDRTEFRKLVTNVHRDFPDWRAEMAGDIGSHENELRALYGPNRDKIEGVPVGPITQLCFEVMAAKFGFALHFSKTGVIVPPGGAVEVRFRTNIELYKNSLPDVLLRDLGMPETLRQGSFDVSDYFSFRAAWFPDGQAGVYVCKVGIAFTTVSVVLANAGIAQRVNQGKRFAPGNFKSL